MSKRHKFIVTSLVLALSFVGLTFLGNEDRLAGIGVLSLSSLILFYWTLREGLSRDATLLSLILPPLFTLGVGLFWFLLPATFYAMLPILILYGVGVYSMVITANVFTVSVHKKIPLARAAKGVSFVLTLFTLFLLYDATLSLRTTIFVTSLIVLGVSFLMFLQGLWVSRITKVIGGDTVVYSGVFSFIVAWLAAFIYFWPVSVVVGSLFLTVAVYVLLGLGQAKLEGRLFKATVNEYLAIGIIVFLLMFIFTNWHG